MHSVTMNDVSSHYQRQCPPESDHMGQCPFKSRLPSPAITTHHLDATKIASLPISLPTFASMSQKHDDATSTNDDDSMQHDSSSSLPQNKRPRIPLELQRVFIASSSGVEIDDVPKNGVAARAFVHGVPLKEERRSASSVRSMGVVPPCFDTFEFDDLISSSSPFDDDNNNETDDAVSYTMDPSFADYHRFPRRDQCGGLTRSFQTSRLRELKDFFGCALEPSCSSSSSSSSTHFTSSTHYRSSTIDERFPPAQQQVQRKLSDMKLSDELNLLKN